ncbi:ATP-binding protein [Corynebacterium sp. HMSC29G08]|uniref:ATP-binding protein n=1 Tax=Corynebacterium sp. HMSC29G08 TaxID=1581069 RepID=UPI0008A38882|nr:DUF4143 domain-containing protein [Corynebacterium sp. HMSC29G08]OFT84014.1 AAA family ATPase [Corynebacterium sp. HMSC29G08]
MGYLPRVVDMQLDQLLPYVSAIAIEGPKGVGKTETAARRAKTVLRLDESADAAALASDPSFSSFPKPLLIDEWQVEPQSWNRVRRAVDDGAEASSFLLTGSATPVAGTDTHSGAARIISLRMRPLALFERPGWQANISLRDLFQGTADVSGSTEKTLTDYIEAIASGGFPGFMQAPQLVREQQLDSYLARIVDRDLPDQGYTVRNAASLMNWLAAYAAASSTTTSYQEILDAATPGDADKPAKTTTMKYREKLAEIWMLDPVPAWDFRRSPFAGLARAPKHQLADPAFVLRLLKIPAKKLSTRFNYMLGPLFESLATLSARVAAQAVFGSVSHFRTSKGDREIDLIVQNADGDIIAIEVKLSVDVDDEDVRHLLWFREQLPEDVVDTVVLTTGTRAYRRADGVAVIPLAMFGP